MKGYFICFALMLLASCEKDLDIDYRSIEPLYVVEGFISEQGTAVQVTRTRDMTDTERPVPVRGLDLILSDDSGERELLVYGKDGYYYSANDTKGRVGTTYTLSVSDGEETCVSISEMNSPGRIGPLSYMYRPDFSDKHILCTMTVLDPGGEDNYYCLRQYKNGRLRLRQIFTDKGNDGGEILIVIPIRFSWNELEEPEDEDDEDWIFRKGDLLEMELQTIDRPVYDYFYSLDLSGNISFNPTSNFTGDCLGYFSAHSSDFYEVVFDPEELLGGAVLP